MLIIEKGLLFKKYSVYFSDKPIYRNWFSTYYMQASSTSLYFGFKRLPKYTKIIDLSADFFNDFDKNTHYEIKRAIREGIECEASKDYHEFIKFYNKFASEKGLNNLINLSEIQCYKNSFIITSAKTSDRENIVYHTYIIDYSIKRTRLLHSASKIYNSNENLNRRALIGRANRFLHLWDMEYFKRLNINIYDFGGYAFNTKDQSLNGINKFKDSFGGKLVEESIYEAYPLFILKYLYKCFKKKFYEC